MTFRDVRDAVPYGNIGNVYFITVASDALVAQIFYNNVWVLSVSDEGVARYNITLTFSFQP